MKPIKWIADKSGIKYPKADLDALKNTQMAEPQRTVQYIKSKMPSMTMPAMPKMPNMPAWTGMNTSQSTPALSGLGRTINRAVRTARTPFDSLQLKKRK
jgi:hypothetical protein